MAPDTRGRDERLEAVTARLRRTPALEAAIREAMGRGDVPGLPPGLVRDDTLERLGRDQEPLEGRVPLDTLEAIVQRFGRPPLLVRNDLVELEPLVDFPAGTDALVKGAEPFVPSVGRVEFVNHSMAWGGTGWVVAADGADRVVATNRHVAKIVARRTADGRGVFLRSPTTGVRYGMNVDFREEVGSLPENAREFEVAAVLYLADDLAPDVALLRLVGDGLPDPLPLADDEAEPDDIVATIGYPAFDSRNDAHDQARYFRDLYDVKRFAPGRVMQRLTGRTTLRHDCTTLGGNSGSPLVRLEDRRVVGLHFSGLYGKENAAVGVATLRALVEGARPTVLAAASAATTTAASTSAGTEALADGVHTPEQLAGRAGYDPGFLGAGFEAPWPGLPDAVRADLAVATEADGAQGDELRYTHFSVRFSTSRRQPLMTAVNIDGRALVKVKRSADKWFADLRIPRELQLGRADYDDPEVDRGHLVRREDPNWDPGAAPGTPTDLVLQANADTFHYTNAAPQHSAMNQGRTLWLGLEEYVLGSARTRGFGACVFTGPVNRDDDPVLGADVLVPLEFWKLVVMVDADREALHATAYVLSQGELVRDLLEKRNRVEANEGFVLGAYRTFQVAVADLADVTGYDLGAYVAADPLGARTGAEATGVPVYVELERYEDAVV